MTVLDQVPGGNVGGADVPPTFSSDAVDAVDAARRGEEWALTHLYRGNQPALVRYLRTHAPGDEEDLASDVWIEAARGLARFEGDEEAFRRFLFTVARRRAIDRGRRRQRRRTDPRDPARVPDAVEAATPEAMVLERAGGLEAVERIRALLPAEQAEVVLLRVVAGLSVGEVAAVLGRKPAAVSVLQHRALRRLADRLGPPVPAGGCSEGSA